ncbi:hypothetical protein NDU88_001301 [Pleurodeles waltl]|uniref:Uncharacterized protein n=1 Tax=Pleurodeles waltl TaxID=8319 RepID=A0AAV7LCR4_PLEWA|nr:hypothetical protein NDU88_001301 [Pleurodeles waltl]
MSQDPRCSVFHDGQVILWHLLSVLLLHIDELRAPRTIQAVLCSYQPMQTALFTCTQWTTALLSPFQGGRVPLFDWSAMPECNPETLPGTTPELG